jgi:two-component system, NtrC family, sensor kinase
VSRLIKSLGIGLALLVTALTVGIAFLSFARKVDTFSRPGFDYVRSGGALTITRIEPGGVAAAAGLSPGDRIITADGQTAASLAQPERSLARKPFPHRLLVVSHGEVREMRLARPVVELDRTYLFLAFVGFLYLLIGLFTFSRERAGAARIFWALCLSSFAVYVVTPAGPHDAVWKAFLLTEDVYRALLPALLLHFFLVFPRPLSIKRRRIIPFLYLPGAAYLAIQEAPLFSAGVDAAALLELASRLWQAYFALFGVAALWRLTQLLRRRREDAEAEKQMRWIGLGVAVGLAPFLLLSVFPGILGLASPLLSSLSVVPLVFIPLAFAYAILKWRLWDVEIFVREALATTAAVLLGGMTFVLLNTLLDRTLEGMAEAGKNVIAFGSGLVLAALLVPMKRRITGVLEKIQYHDTYRARRALLDIARDFSTPRRQEDLSAAIVQRVEDGLHVVPCSLFLFEGPSVAGADWELLSRRLAAKDVWHLRGAAFGQGEEPAAERLHAAGYRAFFALRCAGNLVGALGAGHKDGRVPLSSEDESLLTAVMAQAGLAYENARLYGALAERLEEIRNLQQYQESVIRSSSSGILVIDRDGRLQSANPAFAAIVGRPETDLVGSTFAQVLPDVELPPAPEEGGESAVEARFWNARGEERDLRVSVSAFRGEPDRRVVLVDDVTDRVRAEKALAERERLASLGVLAAGVAHEVNTPIAGLSSYAQLLLAETAPGDPHYKILKKMERQTFRAAHLVNNLLEFARPRARATVRADLRAVISNAAESVETTFGNRRLLFQSNGGSDPAWVMGDPRELEQVFVNLFANARDASPDGSEVTCRLDTDGHSVRVGIADRGVGLPPGGADRLFEPFYTTKKSGGTGLGLAISRDIVRRHGGDIQLAPREGGGVEAVVTLPYSAPAP